MSGRYELPAKHKSALLLALEYVGLANQEADKVVVRLTRHVARFASKYQRTGEKTLAAQRLNWSLEAAQMSSKLLEVVKTWHVNFYDERGQGEHELREVTILAERAHDRALEEIWNNKESGDRALRHLCQKVAKEWLTATTRPLPVPIWPQSNECWSNVEVGVVNPLWVLLDALGIYLGLEAVDLLVRCGRRESLEPLKRLS